MSANRIIEVKIVDRALVPAQVEVWVQVEVESPSPASDIRGRLTGPRVQGATTVEVAYPLRPLPCPIDEPVNTITRRAIIPEASFWDPECPFLYEGTVELWAHGQRVDQRRFTHGFRTLTVGPPGLRINGQVRRLVGMHSSLLPAAPDARPADCDLVMAPVQDVRRWEEGDRFGFFVLGTIGDVAEWPALVQLAAHSSSFGFLASEEHLRTLTCRQLLPKRDAGVLLGACVSAAPATSLPTEVDFIACSAESLPVLEALPQPRVVFRAAGSSGEFADPRIIGSIVCPNGEC
jgi:hypothetical protein